MQIIRSAAGRGVGIEEEPRPGHRGRDFPEQFKPFAREAATSVGEAVALPPGRA